MKRASERAPLGPRAPDKLRHAFEKSFRVCFAFHGPRLIAAARMISDGEYYAGIYDVVVLPEYRQQGIGTKMMAPLLDGLSIGTIMLISVPGKEGFYRKLGFDKLETGMARYRNPERMKEAGYIE